MKKILPVTLLGILLFMVVGGASPPPDYPNWSKWCQDSDDLGSLHGACVSYFNIENATPARANFCRDENNWTFTGAKNRGQCLKINNSLSR